MYYLLSGLFLLVSGRQNTKLFLKITAKIFRIIKAYLKSDFRYMQLTVAQ